MGAGIFHGAFIVLLLFVLIPPGLKAQDNLDDILQGFDETEEIQDQRSSDDSLDTILEGFEEADGDKEGMSDAVFADDTSIWSIDGQFKLGMSYNISHDAPGKNEADWRGLSRLRPEFQLDLNARFSDRWQGLVSAKGFYDLAYTIKGRDSFTASVLRAYEEEVEFKELYLLGQLTRYLDLKIGRQIVVWGKSDNIRVTDVLNPLDIREPGLTDIEDLRLPVGMAKLDYYFGNWNLAGIVIPEIRFDKMPVFGHDFYPASVPMPQEDKPGTCFENIEWALSAGGIFDGWDMDFYVARIFNDTPHLEAISSGTTPTVERRHERLHMYGTAYNRALGNFLLKMEAAFFDGMKYANNPDSDYARIDLLGGFEYSGFKETTVTVECANRHIYDHNKVLEAYPDGVYRDMFQTVLRYSRDFWHDTLTLNFIGTLFGPSKADGAYGRMDVAYDISDTRKVRGGLVLYQSGDLLRLQNVSDNDRVFFEYQYNF